MVASFSSSRWCLGGDLSAVMSGTQNKPTPTATNTFRPIATRVFIGAYIADTATRRRHDTASVLASLAWSPGRNFKTWPTSRRVRTSQPLGLEKTLRVLQGLMQGRFLDDVFFLVKPFFAGLPPQGSRVAETKHKGPMSSNPNDAKQLSYRNRSPLTHT